MAIPQFFSSTVVSWMCGAPKGQNIPGTQVPDYKDARGQVNGICLN